MVLIRIFILLFFISNLIADDFINVKVLDIQSRSKIKKYMKSISKDLGVKCSYCHDMDDKSLDTEHKEIAREMIILTRQINSLLNNTGIGAHADSTNTKTVITCWTCHKGNTHVEKERPTE